MPDVLSSESKQFFWGIFRSVNDKPLPSNAQEQLLSSPADEDMEIGGISAGRVDVIVPRVSSTHRSAQLSTAIQGGDKTTCPTMSADTESSIHDDDMEIDMVGAINVGRVDVIVPRVSSTCRSAQLSTAIQGGDTTTYPTISADTESSIQGRRHIEVKKEEWSKYYNQVSTF